MNRNCCRSSNGSLYRLDYQMAILYGNRYQLLMCLTHISGQSNCRSHIIIVFYDLFQRDVDLSLFRIQNHFFRCSALNRRSLVIREYRQSGKPVIGNVIRITTFDSPVLFTSSIGRHHCQFMFRIQEFMIPEAIHIV